MRIFGPLVCSRISPVTATFASSLASVVTLAPSTTSATGSETDAPASSSSFSTFTMSPTATLYCLPPVLTIAYVGLSAAIVYYLCFTVRARASRGCVRRSGGAGSRWFPRKPMLSPAQLVTEPEDSCSRLRDQRVKGQTACPVMRPAVLPAERPRGGGEGVTWQRRATRRPHHRLRRPRHRPRHRPRRPSRRRLHRPRRRHHHRRRHP